MDERPGSETFWDVVDDGDVVGVDWDTVDSMAMWLVGAAGVELVIASLQAAVIEIE